MSIAVEEISKSFGTFRALQNVSLTVETGELVALLGPSGSGKTTLLRIIAGLESADAGRVSFYGEDTTERSVRDRQVGFVFQHYALFKHMSVYDNVAFGPRIAGKRSRSELDGIVEEALRSAALWDEVKERLKSSATGLSGGQQQRLCIARAMATEPDIILMDEPTSALDPMSTDRIEQLIHEIKKDYTVVIVTHNMQQAGRVSDRTAFMHLGVLIEEGPTDQIFTNPKHEMTERYVEGRFG